MRHYLSTLHARPDHHKKRFALLTSLGFTLIILSIWSLTTFNRPAEVVDAQRPQEVSPFQSLLGGVGASFQAIFSNFSELKQGLEVVNFPPSELADPPSYGGR
ncbi:MAG: hypothetical protein Q7R67_01380 [bacterium]|nr:hypothetical protein [bacterium]